MARGAAAFCLAGNREARSRVGVETARASVSRTSSLTAEVECHVIGLSSEARVKKTEERTPLQGHSVPLRRSHPAEQVRQLIERVLVYPQETKSVAALPLKG